MTLRFRRSANLSRSAFPSHLFLQQVREELRPIHLSLLHDRVHFPEQSLLDAERNPHKPLAGLGPPALPLHLLPFRDLGRRQWPGLVGRERLVEWRRRPGEFGRGHLPVFLFHRALLRCCRFSASVSGRAWITKIASSGSRTNMTCQNRPPRPRPRTSHLSPSIFLG